MAYEVLARKWRPTTFDAMVGQEHVLRALGNALASNRLHHAYLFTGTRGVGKTTVARILARCLNCETGVTATPCGTCASCVEIGEGRFVDLIEVDAASRSRVEETRDLMDNVQYAPTRGRFKVYLIDEVHMLSTASFNALLKTLEEPPPHVKFLLATTDPKKLPVTVLSRCLQFHLKNLMPERIVDYLQQVLSDEAIPADEDALWALARAADGSMRDALSLTDQAIAFGAGHLVGSDVARMLGTIDQAALERILRALAEADGAALLACCDDLAAHGADFAAVLRDLMSALHRIAVVQALPATVTDSTTGGADRTAALCAELAAVLQPEEVQLCYQIALTGHRDLPHAPDPRTGFEMTLLRMLAFQPDPPETGQEVPPGGGLEQPATGPADQQPAAEPATVKSGMQPVAATQASVTEADKPDHGEPSNIEQLDQWRARAEARGEPAVPPAPAGGAGNVSEQLAALREATSGREPASSGNAPPLSAYDDAELPPAETQTPVAKAPPAGQGHAGSNPLSTESGRTSAQAMPTFANGRADSPLAAEAVPAPARADTASREAACLTPEQLPEQWHKVLAELELTGLTSTLATHCLPVRVAAGRVQLALDPVAESLHADMHCGRLEQALSDYFGESLSVEITVADAAAETPAQRVAREKSERQARAEAVISADAMVQSLMETFNASLQPGSIRPLDR